MFTVQLPGFKNEGGGKTLVFIEHLMHLMFWLPGNGFGNVTVRLSPQKLSKNVAD